MDKISKTEKEKYIKIIDKYFDLFSELENLEKDFFDIKTKVHNFSDKKQIHDVLEKINSIKIN
jgi:hypothetical protein